MKFFIFLIFLIPIVMRLQYHVNSIEVQHVFPGYNYEIDIFNWWKSALLYACIIGIIFLKFASYKHKSKILPCSFYSIFLIGYLACVALSATYSGAIEVAWLGMPNYLEGALAILCYGVLFFSASEVCETSYIEKGLKLITILIFIVCAFQFFRVNVFESSPFLKRLILSDKADTMVISGYSWPLYATFMNSNVLGTFAALIYPFFIGRKNWFFSSLLVLIAVSSQSRGAYLSMAIATIYILYCIPNLKKKILTPIIVFAFAIILINVTFTNRVHKFTFSSSGRFYVWKTTIKMIQDDFKLLGQGPAVFALDFPNNDTESKIENGWPANTIIDRPHNFYLSTIYGSGIFAFLFLMIFLFKFFYELSLTQRENQYLVPISGCVLSYLVNVFFTDSCTSVAPIFWVLIGTAVGIMENYDQTAKVTTSL